MIFLDENILVFFLGGDKVRIYHAALRLNTVVSANVLDLFDFIGPQGQPEEAVNGRFMSSGQVFELADATEFTPWECALFNPDNYKKTAAQAPATRFTADELIKQLEKRFIINRSKAAQYPFKKSNMFDRFKGSYHQQLGTEALYRKANIATWWASQKFQDDFAAVKETPYKYIQEKFLESYFNERLKGKKVLEVGCGTGYYCLKMARYAKEVIGIDYQPEYIDIAKERAKNTDGVLSFLTANVAQEINDPKLAPASFDFIFLIDIFLFFFSEEFQSDLPAKKVEILQRLKKLLKPGGTMVIMDPSAFWLVPRFGSKDFSFGVITEYKQRNFRVLPTLQEATQLFYDSGLRVARILEPAIDPAYESIDAREYHFMRQFPQWWVFELTQ